MQQYSNSYRQQSGNNHRHEELASIWGTKSLLFDSDAVDNSVSNINKPIADFGQLGWRQLASCDDDSGFKTETDNFNLAESAEHNPGGQSKQQQRPQSLEKSQKSVHFPPSPVSNVEEDATADCYAGIQRQIWQQQQQQQQFGSFALQPIGTPAIQTMIHQQPQAKLGIGHEIDKWIASVSCCAPLQPCTLGDIDGGQRRQKPELGANRIVVDKSTLLAFLAKLKMYHQKKREMRIELCAFCRQNQEPFHVYTSHRLADINGNVTCPVLFRYVCPICGVSGSKAHTIKYCPLGNGGNGQVVTQRQRLQPLSGF